MHHLRQKYWDIKNPASLEETNIFIEDKNVKKKKKDTS